MFLPLFFTLSLGIMLFLLWKWKKSYLLLFIYFMVHVQVGSHLIDEQREKEYENAMQSDQHIHLCGKYLGTSEMERGGKNNKYKVTLYHFEKPDGQQLTFAYTDLMRSHVPNIDLLQQEPLAVCIRYTPNFRDLYQMPMLTELEFNPATSSSSNASQSTN